MIRAAAAIGLAGLFCALPAQAEEVTVGAGGGFYCKEGKYLIEMMEKGIKGEKIELGSGCAELQPGAKIITDNVEKFDDMAVGRATIEGREDVPFVIRIQKPKPTSEGRTFKAVSPDDVRNTPSKWQGRDIEFKGVNIYWVDEDDVRIITHSMLTLFAGDVRGAERDFFKQNCETQAEALSSKCRATVRFRYDRHGEDQPTGSRKRVVLRSDDVELIRPAKRRR